MGGVGDHEMGAEWGAFTVLVHVIEKEGGVLRRADFFLSRNFEKWHCEKICYFR